MLRTKLAETKEKLEEIRDEYMEKKIIFGRDLAISQQQVPYFVPYNPFRISS